MRGVTSITLLAAALAMTWATDTNVAPIESLGATLTDTTQNEISEDQKEREETTEKNSRQIYTYNRGTGLGTTFTGTYPSNYNPSGNPTVYNPSYNPAGNPTVYNPSYNPSGNPTVYNPSYYPNNYYPNTRTGGGVFPLTPTLGSGFGEAFTVRRASPRTTAGSRVILTQAVTQGGSGWNAGSSEFRATSTGMFFFSFSAVSDRYTQFRLSLRRNGLEVASAYGDASGYQMGSQSAVLSLNSGDRVYLQLDEGRLYDSSSSSRGYTTFSGFRIR